MNSIKRLARDVPVSFDHLQDEWRRLAERYFDDRLPPIIIEWSFRLTASSGMFVSQVSPRSRLVSKEERHGPARRIRLSAPLLRDQPKSEIIRTLAHEMIHQWQYDIKKRCPNHGQDFYDVMARMNRDGLAITVQHSLSHQVEQLSKYLWRCVACGTSYRRQRRSISAKRHRCGNCHGTLEEIMLSSSDENYQNVRDSGRSSSSHLHHELPAKDDWKKPQQLTFNF